MHCNCIIFNSISKIREVNDDGLICTCCPLITEYKELVKSNKIDIIKDINDYNRKNKKVHSKHRHHQRHQRRRNKKYDTNNKNNHNRTLPKSRKKFKDKQK